MCYADGDSISLEELYIPHYLIPKMEGIDLSVFSVYEVYEMYGIHLAEAEQLSLIHILSDEIGININQKHTTICIMHKNKRK